MAGRDTPLVDVADIPAALSLLTRLPSQPGHRGARAAWAWPLAGLIVALLAAAAGWIGMALGLVPGVAAAIVLATQVLLTGALHEDGLADTADGLFGGATPSRRLEIMKDSHIGSFGTLALVLSVLARWAALSFLLATGNIVGPLLAAAVLSRAALPVVMHALPNARGTGLSADTGVPPADTALLGLGLAAILALIAAGWAVIPCLVFGGIAALAVGLLAQAKIEGQTGDILGATQQMVEIAVLATLTAAL